jgi:hypothetical protein
MKIETPVDTYVARLLAEAPPLSRAQLDRLAVLLRPPTERSVDEAA